MKRIILILITINYLNSCYAQLSTPAINTYYLKLSYGKGTHTMLGASLHHINKKRVSISGQLFYEKRVAKNIPEDMEPRGYIFPSLPTLTITTGAILVGKVYEDESKIFRFDIKAGLNYGVIKRPVNFEKRSGSTSFSIGGDYYDYTSEKKWFVGLVLNPTMDVAITKKIGFSFGARANINTQYITAGFEAGLLLGNLRNSTP